MGYKYKKGLLAKDKVTGFTGIITYRCEWLTGCNQYGLSPKVSGENGEQKLGDVTTFDEHRLEILGHGVSLDPGFESDGQGYQDPEIEVEPNNKNKKKSAKGGPGDKLRHSNRT